MFAEAGLERAEIRAAVDNARSRAVAERLGFVEEGVSRHASWVAGRWLDMAIYGQVRAEWQMRRRMNAGQ
jgi:ribosomal-protein-serine acetyltransferase